MRARSWRSATLSIVLLGLWLTAAKSNAQSAPVAARLSNQPPGRFQLIPQPEGTMFLLDTATGRIWRYTLLMPAESDVKASVDKAIALQEASNNTTFSEAERKALFDTLAKKHRDDLQESGNPCRGLTTCFVEVDRVRLGPNGKYASEIVAAK